MAAKFLNVVIDNVAQYMKRKIAEKYSHIEHRCLLLSQWYQGAHL